MRQEWTEYINVVSAIGTLLIAIAALVIAVRQTRIANEQTSLASSQAESAKVQSEIGTLLQRLEVARDTPILIPNLLDYSNGALRWQIVNAGGGCATDVWIDGAVLLFRDPEPDFMVLTLHHRVDFVRDTALISTDIDLPEGATFEKLVALKGHFTSTLEGRVELRYEVPLGEDGSKGGFLRHID